MTSSDSAQHEKIDSIVVLGSTMTALAVVREAANIGKKVFTVDTAAGIAMKSRYPTKVLLPDNDEENILAQLKVLAGQRVALIADSDRWLRFIMRHYLKLTDMFGLVLHPTSEILEVCLHKVTFLKWCHEFNIPAPILYEVDSDICKRTSINYPVIVRPEETRHGIDNDLPKAIEIGNEVDLGRLLSEFEIANVGPVVCESALAKDVRQYSVGIARSRSGTTMSFVAEKVRPVAERCGGGCYVVTRSDKNVEALAVDVLHKLDFFGIAEVEILWNPETNKYSVIEVNARPWVQFPLAAKSGHGLLSFALGEPDLSAPANVRTSKWLWFVSDLYECFSASDGLVRNGNLSVKDYLLSVFGANTYAFWDLKDIGPFIHELRSFLKIAGRSVLHIFFKRQGVRQCP